MYVPREMCVHAARDVCTCCTMCVHAGGAGGGCVRARMSGRARRSCGGGGVGEEKGRAEAREGRLEHLEEGVRVRVRVPVRGAGEERELRRNGDEDEDEDED